MKKASALSLVASFLREKLGAFLLCALTAGLFLLIGSLSHMDMSPLWYALMLCGLVIIPTAILSLSRYIRKFRQAEQCLYHLDTLPQGLPDSKSRLETLYQEIIERQGELRLQEKNEQNRKLKEREDYYTLWMHQIKTPIAAMRLLMQIGVTPEDGQWEEELFKTERYVEMALHYLRLESNTDDLQLCRQDLYTLVKKAVKKYAVMFIHKKISLDLSPFDAQVLTDEKWFLVLLEQILSNAVKYTDKGIIRIFVQDGSMLAIADSGIGISKEDLPRVFERGYTGHNGRADQRATGIGLYLAREVAKRLSHKITIQSEPGRGTTVFIDVSDIPLEIY